MDIEIRFCRTWGRSGERAAGLAATIQERLGREAALTPTDRVGQFDVVVDGEVIASRGGNAFTRIAFGAGFPDPAAVVDELESRARPATS